VKNHTYKCPKCGCKFKGANSKNKCDNCGCKANSNKCECCK